MPNMKTLKKIVLLSFFITLVVANQSGKLSVVLNEIRQSSGIIYVSIHNDKAAFPMKSEKALTSNMVEGSVREVVFNEIPFGEYAVSVFHDENGNGKMDTHLFGIPKEGVGASNNKMGFGPPSFQDAMFKMEDSEKTITINVKYF